MIKKLRLKYCYYAHILDDKTVLLKSEKDDVILSGKLYVEVLTELRDGISTDQLMVKLEGKRSLFEIGHVLAELKIQGYITESDGAIPSETYSYWNNLGMDVHTLKQALQDKPVSIESVGMQAPAVFFQSFAAIGIKIAANAALKGAPVETEVNDAKADGGVTPWSIDDIKIALRSLDTFFPGMLPVKAR